MSSLWFRAAALFYSKDRDTSGYIRCLEKTGTLNSSMGLYAKAQETYNSLEFIYKSMNDNVKLADVYNRVGFIYFQKHDTDTALEYFRMASTSRVKADNDAYFLTGVWSNIAVCHQNLGNTEEMLESFEKALQYARLSGRIDEAARIYRLIAIIYFRKGDNYHAEFYCLRCIEAARSSGNLEVLQLCYRDYSEVLEKGNDFVKALEYYEKHLTLRDSINYENRLAEREKTDRIKKFESTDQVIRNEIVNDEIEGLEIKSLRAESARRENEYKLLQQQQELDKSEKERLVQSLMLEQDRYELSRRDQEVRSLQEQQLRDSLLLKIKNDESQALVTRNKLLETEKKQQELKTEKEKQVRKMAVGIGILLFIVAAMILIGLVSTRKQNQKLAESKRQIEKINADLAATNSEVLKQKEIIEQKNLSITDSIQYARRIQSAVLPPPDFLTEWGIDNFILYKPKDIVSGDFYWGVKNEKRIIVAAGDCTGHGVPGAFMSMLGHAFLDEIVNTREIENAASILNILRDEIISTLKQKGSAGETRDGMDISLVILDREKQKAHYAGANNPLFLIRDDRMIKYQADHMPIGIHFISFTPFTNQEIEIRKGDYLYLFTDGYADQFGGPRGKKFMYKPFQELLARNHREPMQSQKELLDKTFEEWKGNLEQVDDVLVIGMHI
jgi:serine phosphatase RsbU (regulator of sigma subunit)